MSFCSRKETTDGPSVLVQLWICKASTQIISCLPGPSVEVILILNEVEGEEKDGRKGGRDLEAAIWEVEFFMGAIYTDPISWIITHSYLSLGCIDKAGRSK